MKREVSKVDIHKHVLEMIEWFRDLEPVCFLYNINWLIVWNGWISELGGVSEARTNGGVVRTSQQRYILIILDLIFEQSLNGDRKDIKAVTLSLIKEPKQEVRF
jgi:hypothetical protein